MAACVHTTAVDDGATEGLTVHLLVGLLGDRQVSRGTLLRGDQVVAVDGGGRLHARQAAADELQHRHLRRGVLHGHAVGAQLEVRLAAHGRGCGVVQMPVDDLLGQRQRALQRLPDHLSQERRRDGGGEVGCGSRTPLAAQPRTHLQTLGNLGVRLLHRGVAGGVQLGQRRARGMAANEGAGWRVEQSCKGTDARTQATEAGVQAGSLARRASTAHPGQPAAGPTLRHRVPHHPMPPWRKLTHRAPETALRACKHGETGMVDTHATDRPCGPHNVHTTHLGDGGARGTEHLVSAGLWFSCGAPAAGFTPVHPRQAAVSMFPPPLPPLSLRLPTSVHLPPPPTPPPPARNSLASAADTGAVGPAAAVPVVAPLAPAPADISLASLPVGTV